MQRLTGNLLVVAAISASISACSPSEMIADMAGTAMTGGGDVYASDDDPDLVKAALPFGIKTMEGLIESSPSNTDLRLAASRGLAAYAFLVQQTQAGDPPGSTTERRQFDQRVARLYERARDHALVGLEIKYPDFTDDILVDRDTALSLTNLSDAELLYWAGATWSGAIAANKRDLAMVAELPIAASLVIRTAELDDSFAGGAAHEFLLLYEAGRPGGSLDVAEAHYRRALELSGGASAGAYLGYAEMIAVARQDQAAFHQALGNALEVDLDVAPERRLVNVLAQRKARRLIAKADQLFLTSEGGAS